MFKLARNLSSGANVPEPCRLPLPSDMEYRYGAAVLLKDGSIYNAFENEKPTFITGESAKENEKTRITCYPITSSMIFEAPLIGDPTNVSVGSKVNLAVDNGFAIGVSDDTNNGFVTIFSLNGAKKSGDRVYVRFE